MVRVFLFPLLRLGVFILIALGLSLAIFSGAVNAAAAADSTDFIKDMIEKLQQFKEGKRDPEEVIAWLETDGKSFSFESEAAEPLLFRLYTVMKLYGAMVEIPYLRTALLNQYKTSKGSVINFVAQRICESIKEGTAEHKINVNRVAFSHLVRAYQMNTPPGGSFPIDDSVLSLTSLNKQDFVVPGQEIPTHLEWFFKAYKNSKGESFLPPAPAPSPAPVPTPSPAPAVAIVPVVSSSSDKPVVAQSTIVAGVIQRATPAASVKPAPETQDKNAEIDLLERFLKNGELSDIFIPAQMLENFSPSRRAILIRDYRNSSGQNIACCMRPGFLRALGELVTNDTDFQALMNKDALSKVQHKNDVAYLMERKPGLLLSCKLVDSETKLKAVILLKAKSFISKTFDIRLFEEVKNIKKISYLNSAEMSPEIYLNMVVAIARLKMEANQSDADLCRIFLGQGIARNDQAIALWKAVLQKRDGLVQPQGTAEVAAGSSARSMSPSIPSEDLKERGLPTCARVLSLTADLPDSNLATQMLTTGGPFGFRLSGGMTRDEAASIVTSIEKIAARSVQKYREELKANASVDRNSFVPKFFPKVAPSSVSGSSLDERISKHQLNCTVVGMVSYFKQLSTTATDESDIFSQIDTILGSLEGSSSSSVRFASVCSRLDPDFEFSFGERAARYVPSSKRVVSLGAHGAADGLSRA